MKIAIITHTFPPSKKPNAKRPFYIVQSLLDAGWEVDVYTSLLGCDAGGGEAIKHPALKVYVIGDYLQKIIHLGERFSFMSRIFLSIMSAMSWPDCNAPWVKKVSKSILKKKPYDRVLAFVFPASMFLTGRFDGLVDESWTFDLQESVTPQARIVKRRSPLMQWKLPELEAIEKLSLSKAGKVIFTAETNRQAYISAEIVDAKKTVHIPYFYDERSFSGKGSDSGSGTFIISYFGTFDWRGSRSPETFLRSLRKFLDMAPDAVASMKFAFYGSWLKEHNELVEDLGLNHNVEINPSVGYHDYIRKMKESSILLLVVSSAHNLFMPSKIVDYFGARKPILSYVPDESEMQNVLKNAGMEAFTVNEFDEEGGCKAIYALWEKFKIDDLTVDNNAVKKWGLESLKVKYFESLRC